MEQQEVIEQLTGCAAANFYAEQGKVSHGEEPPVNGREAIRKFLNSFAGLKVLDNTLGADSTVLEGRLARQLGHCAQTVVLPDRKVVQVSGAFEDAWDRDSVRQAWKLTCMRTRSDE